MMHSIASPFCTRARFDNKKGIARQTC